MPILLALIPFSFSSFLSVMKWPYIKAYSFWVSHVWTCYFCGVFWCLCPIFLLLVVPSRCISWCLKWIDWELNLDPSACGAGVIPLDHKPYRGHTWSLSAHWWSYRPPSWLGRPAAMALCPALCAFGWSAIFGASFWLGRPAAAMLYGAVASGPPCHLFLLFLLSLLAGASFWPGRPAGAMLFLFFLSPLPSPFSVASWAYAFYLLPVTSSFSLLCCFLGLVCLLADLLSFGATLLVQCFPAP